MRRKGVVFSKMFVLRSMGNELVPSPRYRFSVFARFDVSPSLGSSQQEGVQYVDAGKTGLFFEFRLLYRLNTWGKSSVLVLVTPGVDPFNLIYIFPGGTLSRR